MAVPQPRYSKEEFAQRGDLIYQTQIRPQVELVDVQREQYDCRNGRLSTHGSNF
jgi:hypothetical protein